MTSSQESSIRAEIRLGTCGRSGISSVCSSLLVGSKPKDIVLCLGRGSLLSSHGDGKVPDHRWGDILEFGNDFACRSVGVVERANVTMELLLPSEVSSSSGTPESSVLIIENGSGLRECAESSGVVTACGSEGS